MSDAPDLGECESEPQVNQILLGKGVAMSLGQWIRQWAVFVAQVESGYPLTIYDYLNDIDTRSVLDEVLEVASFDCCRRISVELQPLDARYMAATVEVSEADAWRQRSGSWYRRPKRLTGELEKDLSN